MGRRAAAGFGALLLLVFASDVLARRFINVVEHSVPAVPALNAAAFSIADDGDAVSARLPVFFFHGITNNPSEGRNIEANLTAEGRAFVAFSLCPDACSTHSLLAQVPMAIAQIRNTVLLDDRFQNGYIFIAQSQGGIIARAVIEEMDDHQVRKFISLAGVQNGVFYGPQPEDQAPLKVLMSGFGAKVVPSEIFDFEGYAQDPTSLRGEMQRDLARLVVDQPQLQTEYSFVELARFPAFNDWVSANTFLPVINNVNHCDQEDPDVRDKCVHDKQRRKRNFLKLQAAHFFASPNDGVVAPWQISHFGRYSEVDAIDKIATEFENLRIVKMNETLEYVEDTFGLRTLFERGGLFLHEVPGVAHGCWVADCWRQDDPTKFCVWKSVYDQHVHPLLS